MLLHVHRAMHAVIDRQKDHGIHFRVLAKWLRLAGGDHLHTGTVVGKLEGDRQATLGVHRPAARGLRRRRPSRGIYFDQDWASLPAGACRSPPAASTSGTCPPWSTIFGDDSVLQFGGGTLGHPGAAGAGATANRVALEACVKARNEGRDLHGGGNARSSAAAARLARSWRPPWRRGRRSRFEFDTVDTLGCDASMTARDLQLSARR